MICSRVIGKMAVNYAYLEATGIVKKLDDFERLITMQDGTKIPMDDILTIESDAFSSLEQY